MESPKKEEHFLRIPTVNIREESPCLPLVINAMIRYWGQDPPLEAAASESRKYEATKGAVIMEGLQLAQKCGFAFHIYKSSMKDLRRRIDQGIPPIVILPGIHQSIQHATIVSGYDAEERRILTYVPEPDTIGAIPESRFEKDWEQDDKIMILIIPQEMNDLLTNDHLKFMQSNRLCFEAEMLKLQSRNEEAIEKLQSAVQVDPDNAHAWCLLAGVYNELNLKEAVEYYEKAIKLNPIYYLAFRGLGNYFLKTANYSLADEYYTIAIGINKSRFGPIYKNRAIVRMKLDNNDGAKQDLVSYLEQTPDAQDKDNIRDALIELEHNNQ